MEAFLGPKWPSEATSKASVIKYANQEGSESFGNPPLPLKFFNLGAQWEGSGRDQPHTPSLPLTGSADLEGLRQSIDPPSQAEDEEG